MTTSHASTSQAGTPKPRRRSADLPAARANRIGWNTPDLRALDTVRVSAADASLQVRRARPGGRGAAQTLQIAVTEVLRDGIVARGRLGWGGLDAGFGLAAALPVALLQLFGHDR